MAAGDGRVTIKKLITSLLVIGAIACGAVYMALTSGPVVVKKADTPPAARPLAYEQQINRPDTSAPAPEENAPGQQAAAPAEQPRPRPPKPTRTPLRTRTPRPARRTTTHRKWRRCRIMAT